MHEKSFSKSRSEKRKRYTIIIEREKDDNFVQFEIHPNNIQQKKILHCTVLILIAVWFWQGAGSIFDRFQQYDTTAKVIALVVLCSFLKDPTIERVSVFKNYGIQTSEFTGLSILPTFLNNLFCSSEDLFIPRDSIVDVIINEGFVRQCQVIFYLAIIIKGEDKMRLLFAKSRPRLEDQKRVYNLARNCLFLKEETEIIRQ